MMERLTRATLQGAALLGLMACGDDGGNTADSRADAAGGPGFDTDAGAEADAAGLEDAYTVDDLYGTWQVPDIPWVAYDLQGVLGTFEPGYFLLEVDTVFRQEDGEELTQDVKLCHPADYTVNPDGTGDIRPVDDSPNNPEFNYLAAGVWTFSAMSENEVQVHIDWMAEAEQAGAPDEQVFTVTRAAETRVVDVDAYCQPESPEQ